MALMRSFRLRRGRPERAGPQLEEMPTQLAPAVEIASDDPLLAYLQQVEGPVDVTKIPVDSQAV